MARLLIIALLAIAFTACNSSTTGTTSPPAKNIDSLVLAIRADDVVEVKDVYYNPATQALCIALTDKDNVISENKLRVEYFINTYNIDSYTQVEGTYLYEYKKGKLLSAGQYTTPFTYNSAKLAEKMDKWAKENYSPNYGYFAIRKYLRDKLHDPESMEVVNAYEPEYSADGYYICRQSIRAKNKFGALVLQQVTANIDEQGNILNIEVQ